MRPINIYSNADSSARNTVTPCASKIPTSLAGRAGFGVRAAQPASPPWLTAITESGSR